MQIEGLIPFKSYADQAIASLYFMRISNRFYSLCFVKSVDLITSFDFSASRKAYFKCLGNSFRIDPSKLVSTSYAFPSQLLDFPTLPSFKLNIVSLISKLEFINSTSRSSIYWKFTSFSFIEL